MKMPLVISVMKLKSSKKDFLFLKAKKEDKTKEQITLKSNQFRKYFTLMRVWDMRRK